MARSLSKTRLMGFLQCPKRLWLESHRPELAAPPDPGTRARLDEGRRIGTLARQAYGHGQGFLVDASAGLDGALRRTGALVADPTATPLFEATFQREGLLVRVDVLERKPDRPARLVEVKSATAVKDEHLSDCAIQAWVLEASRVRPGAIAVAHVDSSFVYAGDGQYEGLLVEQDVTAEALALAPRVPQWLDRAKRTLAAGEPAVPVGPHCRSPYECPFVAHCWPQTDYPLTDLPRLGRQLVALVARGYQDVRDVPAAELAGEDQQRVWSAIQCGAVALGPDAVTELSGLPWPRYHLDFETIAFAVPIWAGTRPYQQLPFQWSLHTETMAGAEPVHAECLELDGAPPMRSVATRLIEAIGPTGPVFCYTGFEARCLETLAEFCPDLAPALEDIAARLVDLHAIVRRHYCHPAMHGSWSLKAVLPTIAPDMEYTRLGEVQDGEAAQRAYVEAIDPATPAARRAEIRAHLLRYCAHDTLATVRIARYLAG